MWMGSELLGFAFSLRKDANLQLAFFTDSCGATHWLTLAFEQASPSWGVKVERAWRPRAAQEPAPEFCAEGLG